MDHHLGATVGSGRAASIGPALTPPPYLAAFFGRPARSCLMPSVARSWPISAAEAPDDVVEHGQAEPEGRQGELLIDLVEALEEALAGRQAER